MLKFLVKLDKPPQQPTAAAATTAAPSVVPAPSVKNKVITAPSASTSVNKKVTTSSSSSATTPLPSPSLSVASNVEKKNTTTTAAAASTAKVIDLASSPQPKKKKVSSTVSGKVTTSLTIDTSSSTLVPLTTSSSTSGQKPPLPPSTCTTVENPASSFPTPKALPATPSAAAVTALRMSLSPQQGQGPSVLPTPSTVVMSETGELNDDIFFALPEEAKNWNKATLDSYHTAMEEARKVAYAYINDIDIVMERRPSFTPSSSSAAASAAKKKKISPVSVDGVKFTSENYSYVDDPSNIDDYGNVILPPMSCDTLRAKINTFLASKEMTQTKFLETLSVNSNSFRRFMSYTGRDRGRDNSMYESALIFFTERDKKEKLKKEEEKERLKEEAKTLKKTRTSSTTAVDSTSTNTPAKKKRSAAEMMMEATPTTVTVLPTATPSTTTGTSATAATPVSSAKKGKKAEVDAILQSIANVPFEDDRVFDNCDEVRTKIATFVSVTNTCPMSKFAEAIDATPRSVQMFMAKKGYNEGAGSKIYVNSYRFFEKLRLLKQEAKSNARIKHEKEKPLGFELVDPPRYVWTFMG